MSREEIPKSEYYCHADKDNNQVCPHWSLKDGLPYMENGYCSLLDKSDWDENEEQGMVEVTHFAQNPHRETHKTMESAHLLQCSTLWDKLRICNAK